MCACVSTSMSDIGTMVEFIEYYRFHVKQLYVVCTKGQILLLFVNCTWHIIVLLYSVLNYTLGFLRIDSIILFKTDIHVSWYT